MVAYFLETGERPAELRGHYGGWSAHGYMVDPT